jgi:type IV pilus assembly protein PilZ
MKLPIIVSELHQGKALELDCEQETITLLNDEGQPLGMVSWDSVIDLIRSTGEQNGAKHVRAHPRAPLAVKVKYSTSEGKRFDGLTGGIGGGGLFIESSMPLPVGAELVVEFALPDRPLETIKAKGKVAWVRPKPDRFTLYPGMGVQFTEISSRARENLVDLVRSLIQVRQVRQIAQEPTAPNASPSSRNHLRLHVRVPQLSLDHQASLAERPPPLSLRPRDHGEAALGSTGRLDGPPIHQAPRSPPVELVDRGHAAP